MVNCQGKFRFAKVTSGLLQSQENQSLEHQNRTPNDTKGASKVVFPECDLTAETEKGYSKQASEIGFLGLAKVNSARLTHTLGSAQTRGLSLCTTGTKTDGITCPTPCSR